jgi:hypothetical protein
MSKRFLLAALVAGALVWWYHDRRASVRPVEGGRVSPDGTVEVVCDLPESQRKRNIASKGLGRCVFRSIDYAARWPQVGNRFAGSSTAVAPAQLRYIMRPILSLFVCSLSVSPAIAGYEWRSFPDSLPLMTTLKADIDQIVKSAVEAAMKQAIEDIKTAAAPSSSTK